MARLPRLSVGGWPHLVVLRGHSGLPVFVDVTDVELFRAHLAEAARSSGVALHAYALLRQEVRLLATPVDETALSRMMQALGRRYGSQFNRRHGRSGSLWEGRFRATIVEPEQYLLPAMQWMEQGEAGQESTEGDAPLASSRAHHLGQRSDPMVSDHARFWALGNTPFDREIAYRKLLSQPLPAADLSALADAVLKGWPLGDVDFVKRLASATDRRLMPRKRGRPPKVVAPN